MSVLAEPLRRWEDIRAALSRADGRCWHQARYHGFPAPPTCCWAPLVLSSACYASPIGGSAGATAAAEAAGDRTEAMAQLAEAFTELFRPYAGRPFGFAGAYGFGPTVKGGPGFPLGMASAINAIADSSQRQGLHANGQKVDDSIAKLNETVAAIRRGMRVMAVGIDYARYNRFEQLTPKVFGTGERRTVTADFDYAPLARNTTTASSLSPPLFAWRSWSQMRHCPHGSGRDSAARHEASRAPSGVLVPVPAVGPPGP